MLIFSYFNVFGDKSFICPIRFIKVDRTGPSCQRFSRKNLARITLFCSILQAEKFHPEMTYLDHQNRQIFENLALFLRKNAYFLCSKIHFLGGLGTKWQKMNWKCSPNELELIYYLLYPIRYFELDRDTFFTALKDISFILW